MASVGVIARRLANGHVQYGCAGMSGYFSVLSDRLLKWYDSPDMVEYLFGLGQLRFLGAPGSENGGYSFMLTTNPFDSPHYLGTTERGIFRKTDYVSHGYFYETDGQWYYIVFGAFKIKMPLSILGHHLNDSGNEFDYVKGSEQDLLKYIFGDYLAEDQKFAELLETKGKKSSSILDELLHDQWPLYELVDKYNQIYGYFDDWVVAVIDEKCENVVGYKVRPKEERHIETVEW